jgi:MoCo/4Fe-4S cofactor protein with predicted Tat translocation signal
MPPLDEHNSKTHWRSLADLNDLPEYREFADAEFPEKADPGGLNRRRWLQVMGASFALAGAAGCETKKREILPFASRPEGRTPGESQQFATAMDLSGNAVGLLVTCVDGRPIKVEGNPAHPQSLGATGMYAQAAVLELYDPDRSRNPVQWSGQDEIIYSGSGKESKWARFDESLQAQFRKVRDEKGAGFCVLAESTSSPTIGRLRKLMLDLMPEARWFEYEPLSDDNVRAGSTLAFGAPYRTQLALDKARVIVCLEADLLGGHPAALQHARGFAQGREVTDGSMNRLYVVEGSYTITGSSADHRLAVAPREIAGLVSRLAQEVQRLVDGGGAEHGGSSAADKFLHAMAADLVGNRGRSVVAVGPQVAPEVHAAVHQLNAVLGNVGETVTYSQVEDAERPSHLEAIKTLAADMSGGNVKTLLILGGNPAYNAPADVNFAEALAKVETTIHVGLYRDETAELCQWHVPQAHFLESWGDARSFDGTYSLIQPMIEPLHQGRTWIEVVARVMGQSLPQVNELVKETARSLVGSSFSEKVWRKILHDGLLADSAWPLADVPNATSVELNSKDSSGLQLVFCRDASVYDGRFANSSWLQECPDPLTKVTWDNAALISPAKAKELGVNSQEIVTLKVGDRSLDIPAYVMPGQADGVVTVALGYGRTAAGVVAGHAKREIKPVGANTYSLRTTAAPDIVDDVSVTSTGKTYRLATTQDHFAIDTVGVKERERRVGTLIREASLEHYQEHPDFAKHVVHHPPLESLWEEHKYDGHRWGMSIDLSKCIGCNACVVACQAENNIPVVGKEQVLHGREMHWIRIDRYFTGDAEQAEDVQVAMQPVACHHCELAPCEQVCPVAATVHSHEGLNDMVYNRCIGTRYCANNCPYKVRRFNYFNYHKDLKEASNEINKMVYNPEVTVRSRGVMEKCTYCVQRIQATKIDRKNAQEPIKDGDIQTACQQACPSQAIVFGDLADGEAFVSQLQQADRSYAMLGELNVKPRTTYLAKIRNPHPDLASEPTEAEHH